MKKTITLDILTCNINSDGRPYVQIFDEYNEYSLKNKLNVTVNLTLDIHSLEIDNFESMVESLFMKKKTKYDMYTYDCSYTTKNGEYLLDLNNRISDEHIKLFHPIM